MSVASTHGRMNFLMEIDWARHGIRHQERFFVNRLNTWRDLFPGSFLDRALKTAGARPLALDLRPGDLIPGHDPGLVRFVDRSRLDLPFESVHPGRFYPQGMVRGIPGIFRGNTTPFKCIDKTNTGITGDFNHALANTCLTLTIRDVTHLGLPRDGERGGSCTDWMDMVLSGPGMQACPDEPPIPFLSGNAFARLDQAPDKAFYARDRLVSHVDPRASKNLAAWYGSLVPRGSRVLDLMAGWESHLPENSGDSHVHGIGMNAREMAANPALDRFDVHDLNSRPVLDFPDQSFDAVVCSLSVEYLTRPVQVFNEVARVLAPGGIFALAFSNRWFPEKAVRIWTKCHEFERMGLVLSFFRESGRFSGLSTVSMRGWPRPVTDRYYPGLRMSDPVYGVCGRIGDTGGL